MNRVHPPCHPEARVLCGPQDEKRGCAVAMTKRDTPNRFPKPEADSRGEPDPSITPVSRAQR
jgi:hypothetical protein